MSRRAKLLLTLFAILVLGGVSAYVYACWQSREPFQVRYVAQRIDTTHREKRLIIVLDIQNTSLTSIHCLQAMLTTAPWRPGDERLPYMHWVYPSDGEYPGIWGFEDLETLENRFPTPHALGPILPGETRRMELYLEDRGLQRLPSTGFRIRYEWVPLLRVQYWKCREWIRMRVFGGRLPYRALQDMGFTRTTDCPVELPLPPRNSLSAKPATSPAP